MLLQVASCYYRNIFHNVWYGIFLSQMEAIQRLFRMLIVYIKCNNYTYSIASAGKVIHSHLKLVWLPLEFGTNGYPTP